MGVLETIRGCECMRAAHIPLASHPREANTPMRGRPPPEAVIGGRIGIQIKKRVLLPTTRLQQLLSLTTT